ncbi:HAD family hydrolase [Mucilaginibacter myungsuensis]|uniref:HAD family hydrolase n=1 Tax=Mucilaginibacter myungsuensis TaxID=649104 RepID=A0A929L5U4_9SPHI|nr:HAD family hydrolase [Mucilaginibacter myungsuensis]MBE9663751.1 HAD family hydrolase [Mucilaginibacter myungsuensis]MDN3598923.1 HAD family hydrolase [Mucilaginibacter myungsuensis]
MAIYKHYSFDLWLTLIKSNPLFKQERARIFHEGFNTQGKSLEEVQYTFRQVDLMVNSINETTGKNIDADEMYLMVISQINDGKINLHDIDVDALYSNMEDLIFQHMPVIYCDQTADTLAYLKDADRTVNLLSNTGFIKGSTLRKVLNHLNIDRHFDFLLFSDEAGLSKPNPAFFQLMLDEVAKLRAIDPQHIIHVGDNPRADVWGADMVGIKSLLVNSNNTSITTLKQTHAAQNLFTA